jgi:hypothetical protein
MAYHPYPSWRYHASGARRIVENAEEDAALGPGWASTPAAFLQPPPAPDLPVTGKIYIAPLVSTSVVAASIEAAEPPKRNGRKKP